MNTPPLLATFLSLDVLLAALSESARATHEEELRRLFERQLPPAVSTRVVATLFGYSPSFVGAIVRKPSRYYRVFEIKSGKKVRTIQSPKVALKLIQQWIGKNLAQVISYSESAFGFVPGRSHIDAAARHCGADWVYSLDIKDFFQTTRESVVKQALIKEVNYSERAAELISALSCYNGFLAQGAPSSPVLSNLVFLPYDRQLSELALRYGLIYTRYADDIVFSGKGTPPDDLSTQARTVIESGQWAISPKKEKTFKKPYRLKVHGLLIDGQKPRLTKGYRRRIRALKHLYENRKVSEKEIRRVAGHLNYADQVANWSLNDGNSIS